MRWPSPMRHAAQRKGPEFQYPLGMPRVGIIMGSKSDWPSLEPAAQILSEFEIDFDVEVVSAHRTPKKMVEFAENARARGIDVIIAGAGGAAHLPGMVASITTLPVIGVPVESKALAGVDSLYSIVQMPAGVPVATVGIGNATNAGLLAARILSLADSKIAARLEQYRADLESKVEQMNRELEAESATGRPSGA